MLDTTKTADPILREADRRLASPSSPTPQIIRCEIDGMVIVAEVAFTGRRFVVVADIDREVDRHGWFHFAEVRNPPSWTTDEQDEQIAQVVLAAWEEGPVSSLHPFQTVGQIVEQWERDLRDHEAEGPTVKIPTVSSFDLVFGEAAGRTGSR